VEVDREGNVSAQGEEITRIFVDGKEFFSNDPKLATRNLTAEMIESIQVFDDMSDQAKFTRIDDGSRTRTINIKLKKDRRKGIFGRVTGGLGSSDRYTGNGSVNMFNESRQISVLGGANNINRLGFTQRDLDQSLSNNNNRNAGNRNNNVRNVNNRAPTPGGGANGDGNTESWSMGVNFRDEWGGKATIGGSYFVSNTDRRIRSTNYRQNFFPNDSSSTTQRETGNISKNLNHNINLRFEYTIDSMNSILITPNLTWGKTQNNTYDTISTMAYGKLGEYLAITGTNRRTSERNSFGFNNNLLFRHRFRKLGRTFTIGWNTSYSPYDADGLNETPYLFYRPDGSIRRVQDIKQRYDLDGSTFNNTISTSITEMIAVGKILELNYAYTFNESVSDRSTYDFNPLTGDFDSLNKPLTNYFENRFTSNRMGGNYRVKKAKYDYQLGGAVQFATIDNMSRRAIFEKDSLMKQDFINFFPNASFNYNMGTRKNFRVQYRGSTRAPNITQLQDVLDISNPLRWRTGNPDLKQEFTNNLNLTLNTFNTKTFMFFNTNLQANVISNRIVNSIDTVNSTVQLVRPENVNGAFNVAISSTLGIPLKKVASGRRSPMNLNLTTNLRYNREVSLLYKEVNYNHTPSIGQRVAFNYNIEQKLDLNASAAVNYFDSRYTVQENLNNRFLNQVYGVHATAYFFKRLSVNTDFDMTINSGRSDGFNQTIPIWNSSIGWLMFKKNNGELKFSVVDMLDQNKSINRNTGENFIEDSYVNVLQRYFLVTFMVNINRFGGRPAAAPQQRTTPGQGSAPRGQGGRPPGTRGG
ncbi:MAG TPA: outer membrane beta-barrel protein, partial [Phnomibacter sp.]|nr:outer membrane beta-barrel protein [Phnomibacter sp.]